MMKENTKSDHLKWSDDFSEENYMNASMLKYFEEMLKSNKNELLKEDDRVKNSLKNFSNNAEINDALMCSKKREKHLKEINYALERIEEGLFGYCEETGDPIGIERLKIQPTARYCVEAQEKLEKQKKLRNDSDDE